MHVRRLWAADVVRTNQSITAVQTLRNSQNSVCFCCGSVSLSLTRTKANIFASASVIVAFFAFQQGSNLSVVAPFQSTKFYVLGCAFVAAFLCFGMSVRDAEQCGYLSFMDSTQSRASIASQWADSGASVDHDDGKWRLRDLEIRSQACARAAAHCGFFWSMGLKFFYFCVCIGSWIASPVSCLVITLVMIVVMLFFDRSLTLEKKAV
jgi:uncharacterized membrane protein